MRKDTITIITFNSRNNVPKSIKIKSSHLKLAIYTFFGFTMLSILSFFFTYKFYRHAEANTSQKKELVNQLVSQADVLDDITKDETALKSKLIEIEEKIYELQQLLDKKGLNKEISAGGEYIPYDRGDSYYVDSMQKDLEELFDTIKNFPLGRPVKGKIVSGFGYRRDPFIFKPAFHSGVDINAHYNQPISATADGIVEKAGWHSGYGKAVILKHENGYQTLYGHLTSVRVKEGQSVKSGDIIGNAGSTGRSTGTHLHYEIIKSGKKVNPSRFFSLK